MIIKFLFISIELENEIFLRQKKQRKSDENDHCFVWFFFSNGMYSVEEARPFEATQNLGKIQAGNTELSLKRKISSTCLRTIFQPKFIPFIDEEDSEIVSYAITPDKQWFFFSVYQKKYQVNFLFMYKRKGNQLEFYSKLNVQNLQGKKKNFNFFYRN